MTTPILFAAVRPALSENLSCLQTTGLSVKTRITEIGAVKIKNGRLPLCHTYVNPLKPISKKITELTGITDEIRRTRLPKSRHLRCFIVLRTATLVAHNAAFDTSFITLPEAGCP